jgi:hypothetical protein
MTAITFACSICGDPATEICVYCTKDACGNHLCAKCHRCSDCCECSVALDEPGPAEHEAPAAETAGAEAHATGSEAIATGEVPDDPDAPVAEDLAENEDDPARSDTPRGSVSS